MYDLRIPIYIHIYILCIRTLLCTYCTRGPLLLERIRVQMIPYSPLMARNLELAADARAKLRPWTPFPPVSLVQILINPNDTTAAPSWILKPGRA